MLSRAVVRGANRTRRVHSHEGLLAGQAASASLFLQLIPFLSVHHHPPPLTPTLRQYLLLYCVDRRHSMQ